MIRPLLKALAVGFAGASLIAISAAAEPATAPEELFKQLDKNGDGQVAEDEVPAEKRRLFDRLVRKSDANEDGKLSQTEFAAGLQPLAAENAEKPSIADSPSPPEPAAGPLARLRQLDANGDGKVTLDEAPEPFKPRFKEMLGRLDTDGDGALGLREVAQAGRQRAGAVAAEAARESGKAGIFATLDVDGDGRLDEDEIAGAADLLRRLDQDGDGSLTPREAMQPAKPESPAPKKNKPADPQARLTRFLKADQNGDGTLSKEEAPEAMRKRFDAVDRNSDGQLDREELRAYFEKSAQPKKPKKSANGKQAAADARAV